MHKTEIFLENERHKILKGSEIKTDHLIPAGRPDVEIIKKKKNLLFSGLYYLLWETYPSY